MPWVFDAFANRIKWEDEPTDYVAKNTAAGTECYPIVRTADCTAD